MVADGCLFEPIQPVYCLSIPAGYEVSVGVHRHLNRTVPHLLFYVGQGLAVLDQQGRKRMPQVMDPDMPHLRFPQEWLPDGPMDGSAVHHGAGTRRKQKRRLRRALLQRPFPLLKMIRLEGLGQPSTHIHSSRFSRLRCPNPAAISRMLDNEAPAVEVHAVPA